MSYIYRYEGVCDKDGCDYASYRLGNKNFFGRGQNFVINTEQQKISVITQFITDNNSDNGNLVEVRRMYKLENGQVIDNR